MVWGKENQNLFRNYFDFSIKYLKLSALWTFPGEANKFKKKCALAYILWWTIYLHFFYFPTEAMILLYNFNNLNNFIRCLRDAGNHIASMYKTATWFAKQKEILKLVHVLTRNEFYYEDYRDFKPREIVAKNRAQSMKWSLILWYSVNGICACMFFSSIIVFFVDSEGQYITEHEERFYRQKLPVNVVSPFGSDTRSQYLINLVYVIVALTFYGWMIITLDSFFITIISCTSAHFEILTGAVKSIVPRCLLRLNRPDRLQLEDFDKEVENEIERELHKCIRHLQTLYWVAQKLEDIFNVQTFVQVLISLFEICFCLYLLMTILDENSGNELFYLLSTSFQLLMYCYFGNKLTEASIDLFKAFFNSNWLNMTSTYKKNIIFTLCRMNRTVYVTIGKITPLTFTTFLTIARGAYSFCAFLRQKQSRI